ncbi:MAG: endonuclease III domain-containing protein [Enterobacteriaceae bacterium]
MNKDKRILILKKFDKYYPKKATDLIYRNKFELLISILLSAKSRDKVVNKVTKKLFSIANSPEKILLLGIKKLKKHIKKIGLFNKKSYYIIKICKYLIFKFKGKVPKNEKDILSLPGIGIKSANMILNIYYNKNRIAVDTHVFRVSNRTKFAKSNKIHKLEKKIINLVPKKYVKYINRWFVHHGKNICKYKLYKCKKCIINKLCEYKGKIND